MAGATTILLASAAPFSGADMLAIAAFVVDLVVGPLSLVILTVAAVARRGWRAWIAVVAVLDLLLAAVLIAFEDGGLGPFVVLAWAQAVIAAALLAIGTRSRWRTAVFGTRA